jgi:N-acetylglutamate synthase-like GNAT family acetyltransferase
MSAPRDLELVQIGDTSDVAALNAALRAAGLPEANADRVDLFKFVRPSREGAGYAGLEGQAPDILLRSFVVRDGERGAGVGAAMLASVLAEVRSRSAKRVWLLTTTAAAFFSKTGFQKIERSAAPAAISETEEFASVCPATAICMWKDL